MRVLGPAPPVPTHSGRLASGEPAAALALGVEQLAPGFALVLYTNRC